MKKLLLFIIAMLIVFTAFEVGQAKGIKQGVQKQDSAITERVITRVTNNIPDKYNCIEVVNINNPHDVIAIEAIPGIKIGKGVQVNFYHDTVTSTKELNYFPNK